MADAVAMAIGWQIPQAVVPWSVVIVATSETEGPMAVLRRYPLAAQAFGVPQRRMPWDAIH